MIVKQGQTNPNDWKLNSIGGGGIYVDVDTSSTNFPKTPHYLTSLEGKLHHFDCGGVNAIYNPTKNGFRVYIKWIYKKANILTPEVAKNNGWYVKWTGIIEDK